MSRHYKTFFVVNPHSGHGRGKKIWEKIRDEVKRRLGHCDYEYTDAQGHGMILSTDALKRGYEMIVAVGGDGTINEVVNGFFEDDKAVADQAILGVIPAGTGCDFVRCMDYPKDVNEQVRRLGGKETRVMDMGHVSFVSQDGMSQARYFINVAGCGLPGELVDEIKRVPRRYGGQVAYLLGLVRALRRHENRRLSVQIDGAEPIVKKCLCAVVANGQYFGSGMHIAPDAIPDDGWLDFVLIGDVGIMELLRNLHQVYTGQLRSHPRVEVYRARQVTITAAEPVLLDVDGEQPGVLPATYRILPKSLRLKA